MKSKERELIIPIIINAYPEGDERAKEEIQRILSVSDAFGIKSEKTKVFNIYEFKYQEVHPDIYHAQPKIYDIKLGRSVIHDILSLSIYSEPSSLDYHLKGVSLGNLYEKILDICRETWKNRYVFIFVIGMGKRGFIDKDEIPFLFISNSAFNSSSPPEDMFARCEPLYEGQFIHPLVNTYESPVVADKITIEGDVHFGFPLLVTQVNQTYYRRLETPLTYNFPVFDYDEDGVIKKIRDGKIECTHKLVVYDGYGRYDYNCYNHKYDEKEGKHIFYYIRPRIYPNEGLNVVPVTSGLVKNRSFSYLEGTEDIVPNDTDLFKDNSKLLRSNIKFSSIDLRNIFCVENNGKTAFHEWKLSSNYNRGKHTKVFLFIDCNYSGNFATNIRDYLAHSFALPNTDLVNQLGVYDIYNSRNIIAHKNFAVWTSCSPNQLSWSDARMGKDGVFIHQFVEYLQQIPKGHYKKVKDYLTNSTRVIHVDSKSHEIASQDPQYITKGDCFDNTSDKFPYRGKLK